MSRYVETLLYTLKPGEGAAFDRIMRERSVPLHQAAGMDVVACGNSLHDPDAYVLIRAYGSLEHLRASQEAFYASEAWRAGPREAIVERIAASLRVVTLAHPEAVDALRASRHCSA